MAHETLLTTLASYVSPFVVRRLAIDPTPPTAPIAENFPVAVFFADIAGFTALTERLAQRGPAGAEELTTLVNRYFGQLIDIVTAFGGDVVKFAGDALLACWSVMATDQGLSMATSRAAQCGLAVQAALHDYEITRGMHLSLHMSIGAGDVSVIYIGGVFDRWEFSIAGEPLVQVGQAEQYASPGEVIFTPAAWALLHNQCTGQPLPAGYARLIAVHTPARVQPATQSPLIPAMETALEEYVPAAIVARLRAGHSEWLGELRRLTVLFVNLPDLDYITPLVQAQTVMRALQTALYRYEGSVNKLSVDDKGITLVAALGLPPLAHEDDAVRGVQAAQAMQSALGRLGVRSAIGVTTGRVFCGIIGNTTRREYTIMGDVVNLAARLMQAAPEDMLCDNATYHAAHRHFTFDALPARHVKGKAAPVSVYRPRRPVRSAIASSRTLIGRTSERRFLTDQLQALLHRSGGGLVIIEGEAGIGKSHLVDDLYHQAQGLGVNVLMGAGNAIDRTTPYHPWQAVFLRLFQAESCLDDPQALWTQVRAQLPAAPEVEGLAPLLAAVLPVHIPNTTLTARLAPQARAESTHALLARLLCTAAIETPMLLLLEDAHWFDSVSWTLLAAVCREVTSALIVVTTRLLADPIPEEYWQLRSAPTTQRFCLNPLSLDDTVALVCRCLGVTALPVPVINLIHEKAAGHPFFSQELAYALRDASVIRVTEGTCKLQPDAGDLRAIPFPETLDGVITSRLDRLPLMHQLLLKVASVVGPVVPVRLLQAINPVGMEAAPMAGLLAELYQTDFLLPEHDPANGTYRFKHTLTHEVVYNLLPLAQRRPLHRAVAEWYEHTHANDLAVFYPLLAHHYTEADLSEQAIPYWQRAGELAVERSANAEAVSHFTKGLEVLNTLPVTPECTGQEQRQQQELELLGGLRRSLGILKGWAAPELTPVLTRLWDLSRHIEEDRELFHHLFTLWSSYIYRMEHRQAQIAAELCLPIAQRLDDPLALITCHNVMMGGVLCMQGEFAQAWTHIFKSLSYNDPSNFKETTQIRVGQHLRVQSHANSLFVLWHLGYPDQAWQQLMAASNLANHLADPISRTLVLRYSALLHQWYREWQASEHQARALIALAKSHGFNELVAHGKRYLGASLVAQGDFEGGIAQLHEAEKRLQAAGTIVGKPHRLTIIADADRAMGRLADGQHALAEALTLTEATGERWCEAETHRLQGELLLAQLGPDDPNEKAEACFHRALNRASSHHAKSWQLRAATSLARLWQHKGKQAEARELLAPVYGWFTEGFDTADLKDAADLLEELRA